jgi:hypothetical protein
MRRNPNCSVPVPPKKTAKDVFFEDNNSRHLFCKKNLECPLQSNTFRKKKTCPSVTDAVALQKKTFFGRYHTTDSYFQTFTVLVPVLYYEYEFSSQKGLPTEARIYFFGGRD